MRWDSNCGLRIGEVSLGVGLLEAFSAGQKRNYLCKNTWSVSVSSFRTYSRQLNGTK
jgi:hypothetical protein